MPVVISPCWPRGWANGSGDLIVSGSSIKGQNVTLGAARDLVLQSAVNSSDSSGSNHSSGWNAGVSFGFSQGSAGISIFANMNAAKGKENGDSIAIPKPISRPAIS